MRNPNGFGSVYKLPGNRRKPWTARITVAHIEGHYQYRYLGYYKTQAEAMMALAEYNKNPYDTSGITLGEVFSRFLEDQKPKVAENTFKGYMTVFNNTKAIHDREMAKVKLETLQMFMDTCGKSYIAMKQMKDKLVTVWEYAMRYEWAHVNYAKMINVEKHKTGYVKREKAVFTADEIKVLWSIADKNEAAEMLVILIYTGLRIGELLALKSEDVDLDKKCFYVRRSKTAAGVRTVPIADCIYPLLQKRAENGKVFNMDYGNLSKTVFPKFMSDQKMTHTLHETRHTFISMMAEAGVDERITKSIVGHTGGSITETVYTHISLEPMLAAVNKLPVYKS